MTRRKERMSRSKSRTMWLAWLAWGIFGAIFVFEDTGGGTGWFAWLMTAPFWVCFALWPALWAWLWFRKDPEAVDFDDDLQCDGKALRVVIRNGIAYAEPEQLKALFGQSIDRSKVMKLPGGNEDFVQLQLDEDSPEQQRLMMLVNNVILERSR